MTSAPEFDRDDIVAMRQDGSLADFLQHLIRQALPEQRPAPAPRRNTDRPPGAWPAGTRPSQVARGENSKAEWLAALAELRDWLVLPLHLRPSAEACQCAGCRALSGGRP